MTLDNPERSPEHTAPPDTSSNMEKISDSKEFLDNCPRIASDDKDVIKLKRLCAGKKGSITKRIARLKELMRYEASRSKVRVLKDYLLEVRVSVQEEFTELTLRTENPDPEWMLEINERVDECVSEVKEYIDARELKSTSSSSLVSDWINRHRPQFEALQLKCDDVAEESLDPETGLKTQATVVPSKSLSEEELCEEFSSIKLGDPKDSFATPRKSSLQSVAGYVDHLYGAPNKGNAPAQDMMKPPVSVPSSYTLVLEEDSWPSPHDPSKRPIQAFRPVSVLQAPHEAFTFKGFGGQHKSDLWDSKPYNPMVRSSLLPVNASMANSAVSFKPNISTVPALYQSSQSQMQLQTSDQPSSTMVSSFQSNWSQDPNCASSQTALSTVHQLSSKENRHQLTNAPGFNPPGPQIVKDLRSTRVRSQPETVQPSWSQREPPRPAPPSWPHIDTTHLAPPVISKGSSDLIQQPSWPNMELYPPAPPGLSHMAAMNHAPPGILKSSSDLVQHPGWPQMEPSRPAPPSWSQGDSACLTWANNQSDPLQPVWPQVRSSRSAPPNVYQVYSSATAQPNLPNATSAQSFLPYWSRTNSSIPFVQPTQNVSQAPVNVTARTDFQPRITQQSAPVMRPPASQPNEANHVDSWIDDLDMNQPNSHSVPTPEVSSNTTMAYLIQQTLPRTKIPQFDGSPSLWVEFITKFRDLVHLQVFFTDSQRNLYLLQSLSGEAKRSVQEFANDGRGYVLSLKRLKYLFGQKSRIAQAIITKVTMGRPVLNDDAKGLVELYYTISDCLVTLRMLNYSSDLYSSDVLRQTVRRLPSRLHNKWAETCLRIRQNNTEPNLLHLETWLQARVMASKESIIPEHTKVFKKAKGKYENSQEGVYTTQISDGKSTCPICKENHDFHECDKYKAMSTKEKMEFVRKAKANKAKSTCYFCKEAHRFYKCETYKSMSPTDRMAHVKKMKLCFNCLSSQHGVQKCQSKYICFAPKCSAKHHSTLHEYYKQEENEDSKENPEVTTEFTAVLKASKAIYLQVVPVLLKSSSGKTAHTHALLDSASQTTLLRADMAKKLCLKEKPKSVKFTTVKDKDEELNVREVSFEVHSIDKEYQLEVKSALAVPIDRFHMPSQPIPPHQSNKSFTHLSDIHVDAVNANEITLLIGADVPQALLHEEVRTGSPGEPIALRTKFGWTLFGGASATNSLSVCHLSVTPVDDQLNSLIERFWTQEEVATVTDRDVAYSQRDKAIEQKLVSETVFQDGKYTVPMLWKYDFVSLPNNAAMAKRRFDFLETRLRKHPKLAAPYLKIGQTYQEMGYARVMSKREAKETSEKTWYLCHHPVIGPKMRMVFDTPAKYQGTSLNDNLDTGPDYLNSLIGVLLRFRNEPVAISADIEAHFHQVKVPVEDTDSLRFYWKRDIHSNEEPEVWQMLVHVFGAKDSASCSNYAVKRTARDNHDDFDPLTFKAALKSFYADDLLHSEKTDEAIIRLAKQLIHLMNRGGFRLTKFASNSKTVMDALPHSECKIVDFSCKSESENLERTLGIYWHIAQDVFTFKFSIKPCSNTKRAITGVISSIFDPLGWLSPFILPAKLLLQEMWRQNIGWDESIADECVSSWESWLKGLSQVNCFQIPRWYGVNLECCDLELHIFGDSSERAYGAVAYLRCITKSGDVETHLIMSKSKLAPIKTLSLPKLELNAAVLAVRIYRKIISELDLPVERSFFWSDSELTLHYIKNEAQRYLVYFANRVTEILEVTNRDQWMFVPGKENPADLVTRGITDPSKLMKADKHGKSWIHGPEFLKTGNFPTQPMVTPVSDNDPAVKKAKTLVATCTILTSDSWIERFSKWSRLRRSAAWVFRFIHNCRNASRKQLGELTPEEIKRGETFVVHIAQQTSYKDEMACLARGLPVSVNSKLLALLPFLDEVHVIRVGGRLENALIPHDAKHQIILPQKHHLSTLIIRYEHESEGHVGRDMVSANLRQKWWIVGSTTAIKSVLFRCLDCKKKRAKGLTPLMANLPAERLTVGQPPFTNTGIDLFGPMLVKHGRQRLKRWGVIFTCLTTRSLHLEVVESAESDSFINSLRRFTNRRSKPRTIFADRGTNFKGASSELKRAAESLISKIGEQIKDLEIGWKFNPPSAPHMGGIWERIIRSVKEVLTSITDGVVLTDFQLSTFLTEVERILNGRPLTPVSNDVADLEALTPNHILIGHHSNWDTIVETQDEVSYTKRWKHVQQLTSRFWNRWQREYVPLLTKRSRWRAHTRNVQTGDLMLLIDADLPRGRWPLARVIEVLPGNDGIVRVVRIKTGKGTYTRPVTKLCFLENFDVRHGEGDVPSSDVTNDST